MGVPVHMKFVFRGVFVGTPEEWSFSVKFSRDNPGGADATVGEINEGSVTAAITNFFATSQSAVPNNARLIDWRAYSIGPNNRAEGQILQHTIEGSPVTGGVAPQYPPQVALVITTVGLNRGLAHLGRFYLPTAIPIADSDLRVSTTNIGYQLASTTQFLKDLSDTIDLELTQSSEMLNISNVGTNGARQTVDHIEVGRVLDTLRNRRKSMEEDRVASGHIDW